MIYPVFKKLPQVSRNRTTTHTTEVTGTVVIGTPCIITLVEFCLELRKCKQRHAVANNIRRLRKYQHNGNTEQ